MLLAVGVAVAAPVSLGSGRSTGSFSVSIHAASEDTPASSTANDPYVTSTVTGHGSYTTAGPGTPWLGDATRYQVTGVSGAITVVNHFKSHDETIQVALAGSGFLMVMTNGKKNLSVKGVATGTGCSGGVDVGLEPGGRDEWFGLYKCGGDVLKGERWTRTGVSIAISGAVPGKSAPGNTTRHTWLLAGLRAVNFKADGFDLRSTNGTGTFDVSPSGAVTKVAGSLTLTVAESEEDGEVKIKHLKLRVEGGASFRRSSGSAGRLVAKVKVVNLRTSSVDCIADPEGFMELVDGSGAVKDSFRLAVCEGDFTDRAVRVNIR